MQKQRRNRAAGSRNSRLLEVAVATSRLLKKGSRMGKLTLLGSYLPWLWRPRKLPLEAEPAESQLVQMLQPDRPRNTGRQRGNTFRKLNQAR